MKTEFLTSLKEYKKKNMIVYKLIKGKILNGEIKPGEKIVIRKIASDLKVSETPVREALITLESKKLVSSIPHIGYICKELDLKELQDILTVRVNLEYLASEIAVENASKINFQKLDQICKDMNNCIKNNDITKYGVLNIKFHQVIYKACDNFILYDLIMDLWGKAERMRSVFLLKPEIIKDSYKDHIKLIELFRKKEKAAVIKIMKNHKKRVFAQLFG
jgi:DNA-binding GntR family transcriptional regulator